MDDIYCECCRRRCKKKHFYRERVAVPSKSKELRKLGVKDLVCPACGCDSYYALPRSEFQEKTGIDHG